MSANLNLNGSGERIKVLERWVKEEKQRLAEASATSATPATPATPAKPAKRGVK